MPDLRRDLPGPAERAARLQRILNTRPIPPLSRQHRGRTPIPVRARMVWERDGVEHLDTVAIDWVDGAVLVHVRDDRHLTQGAWLDIDDIRRRADEAAGPRRPTAPPTAGERTVSDVDQIERAMQHLDDPDVGTLAAVDAKLREVTRVVLALLLRDEWDWDAKQPAAPAQVLGRDVDPSRELTPAEQWAALTAQEWPDSEPRAIDSATIALGVAVAESVVR